MMDTDLLEAIEACIDNRLDKLAIKWHNGSCVCVVIAAKGYPDKYETGKLITGDLKDNDDTMIFHCGTKKEHSQYFTAGGRVLAVTGIGKTLSQAREKSYSALKKINFDKMYYRTDIGK